MKTWMILVVVICLGCGGCQEEVKVWGNGDLPVEWSVTFGEENISRLAFVNTQRVNKLGTMIEELKKSIDEIVLNDPNE